MSKEELHILQGRVIEPKSQAGVAGLRVEVWGKDLLRKMPIGNVDTDARGAFQIGFETSRILELFGKQQPDVYFKVFRDDELIKNTQESLVKTLIVGTTEAVIEVDLPGGQQTSPIVKGHIYGPNKKPLGGALVRAFDRNLRSEELLGEATTDKAGYYQIAYSRQQFPRSKKPQADLIIRVFDPKGVSLGESSIVFNARDEEVVDLVIGAEHPKLSEYEQVLSDVTLVLQGLSPADIAEDEEHHDVAFLAEKTGHEPQHIILLAQAHRAMRQTQIPAEVYYGFFRRNLPTDLPTLLTKSRESLHQALEIAIQDNIIPMRLRQDLESILNRLDALEVEQPAFLVRPELLYGSLTNLDRLPDKQRDFFIAKLNGNLRETILTTIGPISAPLMRVVRVIVARLDFRKWLDTDLATVIKEGVLPAVKKDKSLLDEVATLESRLTTLRSMKVKDQLRLDAPVRDNPIFEADTRRLKLLEYARLAQLEPKVARKILEKHISPDDFTDAALSQLVTEGVINDQQKAGLRLTLELGKLTGHNLAFVEVLKAQGLTSTAELVTWENVDWQRLITDRRVPVPPGDSVETYAETIRFNIERTYPTQCLLTRLLRAKQTGRLNLLETLNSLLQSNERLIEDLRPAPINWQGVDPQQRERLQEQLTELVSFSNAHRHLGITTLINDKQLNLQEKKRAIATRLESLDTFYKNNLELDLRLANFFVTDGTLNWNDIPASTRPLLRKQLMAYQRMLTLGQDASDRERLLSKGYDSSLGIMAKPEGEFVEDSGFEKGKGRMIYGQAQESALSVSHTFAAARDLLRGHFQDLNVGNVDPSLVNDLRQIDGYADFFGPQDYCDCEDCRSMLSPAAYFVDLMHFIEEHISRPVFIGPGLTEHPLYLKNRRRDLWTLRLTCENTKTLIPYLTIVNEVLETYLNKVVQGNIFQTLSDAKERVSFGVPFNLPLEETRLYLSHFGISLHEIYRTLRESEEKMWRAKLNLSPAEFGIITKADPDSVIDRFGRPNSIANFDLQEFIRVVGVTREQLDELLALRCHPDLQAIKVMRDPIPDEFQRFREILTELNNDRLDFIHRFVRLWRKTRWSLSDLDLVLNALSALKPFGDESDWISQFAQLVDIQGKLTLIVEELCALVDELPVSRQFPKPPPKESDRRLYERLFDLKGLFGEKDPQTHELNTQTTFYHDAFNTTAPKRRNVDEKTPLVLGGLGISETDLLLLFSLLTNEMPFDTKGNTVLDRRGLSLLYRHARVAKALKLTIADFVCALRLNFPTDNVLRTLSQLQQLREFRGWLTTAPFTAPELGFILTGEESSSVKHRVTVDSAAAVIQEVQASPEPDKIQVLQAALSRFFNVPASQLSNLLAWISIDIVSPGIAAAINARFHKGDPENPDLLVPENPEDLTMLLDLMKQMERVLLLWSKLKLTEKGGAYLTAHPEVAGIANLKALGLNDVNALTFYRQQTTETEEAEAVLQMALNELRAAHRFSDIAIAGLADLWKQDKSLIASLTNSLSLSSVPLQAVEDVWQGLQLCGTLGINGWSLQKLARDGEGKVLAEAFREVTEARDVALGAFASKYDDEKVREQKLEPYRDRINVLKRDALCDYIIAREKDLKFKDLRDIYAHFLLDVEMSGCFRISRVVSAISSLQLYVQRCLLSLEQSDDESNPKAPYIHVTTQIIDEWDWRKNYRVWEANRKVFFNPENYLEPGLRDNKTHLFKELEDELLQEKITKESAEAAYKKYVKGFAELARLKIAGRYYHDETNTYYFFGRTQQDPPQYYYRKWLDTKEWTPWEKIELGISSDHVSAVIHHGRLYLFWGEITTKEITRITQGTQEPSYFFFSINGHFSSLDEHGDWKVPQPFGIFDSEASIQLSFKKLGKSLNFPALLAQVTLSAEEKSTFEGSKTYRRLYPSCRRDLKMGIGLTVAFSFDKPIYRDELPSVFHLAGERALDLFSNRLSDRLEIPLLLGGGAYLLLLKYPDGRAMFIVDLNPQGSEARHEQARTAIVTEGIVYTGLGSVLTNKFDDTSLQSDINIVHNAPGEYVLKLGSQQYLTQHWWRHPDRELTFPRFHRHLYKEECDEIGGRYEHQDQTAVHRRV